MFFTKKEKTAILKAAIGIAQADGKVADEEKVVVTLQFVEFGVSPDEIKQMGNSNMELSETFAIIAAMSCEQKKYVNGFFAAIIAADGNIDESELKLWALISLLCKLPKVSMAEALQFWSNH